MEDTKPNVGGATEAKPDVDSSQQINLNTVRDQEGNSVQFKIKRSTPLKKLMDAYASRMGAATNSYRFMFDGERLNADDTPERLEMDELDCIDALLEQLGGYAIVSAQA